VGGDGAWAGNDGLPSRKYAGCSDEDRAGYVHHSFFPFAGNLCHLHVGGAKRQNRRGNLRVRALLVRDELHDATDQASPLFADVFHDDVTGEVFVEVLAGVGKPCRDSLRDLRAGNWPEGPSRQVPLVIHLAIPLLAGNVERLGIVLPPPMVLYNCGQHYLCNYATSDFSG